MGNPRHVDINQLVPFYACPHTFLRMIRSVTGAEIVLIFKSQDRYHTFILHILGDLGL